MKKISNIFCIAAIVSCAASCTHKQLADFGNATGQGQYEKNLKIGFDWNGPVNEFVDRQTSFESASEFFMSTKLHQLDIHVMPAGQEYHIDSLVNDKSPAWEQLRSDIYKSVTFPARTYRDHAHFAGVYDIFATTLNDYQKAIYLDTMDMATSIKTTFDRRYNNDIRVIPMNGGKTKATSNPQFEIFVPGLNDYPVSDNTCNNTSADAFYYGSKKGVIVKPGKTEDETQEVTIEMKKLKECNISIFLNTDLHLGNQMPGTVMETSLMVTGLAGNYDLLNDKPVDPYNGVFFGEFFGTNNSDFPRATQFFTLGVPEETGKVEACLFGRVALYIGQLPTIFYWYRTADITDKVKEIMKSPDRYLYIELFKGGTDFPNDAVPSTDDNIVWNKCN